MTKGPVNHDLRLVGLDFFFSADSAEPWVRFGLHIISSAGGLFYLRHVHLFSAFCVFSFCRSTALSDDPSPDRPATLEVLPPEAPRQENNRPADVGTLRVSVFFLAGLNRSPDTAGSYG